MTLLCDNFSCDELHKINGKNNKIISWYISRYRSYRTFSSNIGFMIAQSKDPVDVSGPIEHYHTSKVI